MLQNLHSFLWYLIIFFSTEFSRLRGPVYVNHREEEGKVT